MGKAACGVVEEIDCTVRMSGCGELAVGRLCWLAPACVDSRITYHCYTRGEYPLGPIFSDLLGASFSVRSNSCGIPYVDPTIVRAASEVFSILTKGNGPCLASFYVICRNNQSLGSPGLLAATKECRTYDSALLLPLLLLFRQLPDADLAAEPGTGSCLAVTAHADMVSAQLVCAVECLNKRVWIAIVGRTVRGRIDAYAGGARGGEEILGRCGQGKDVGWSSRR